MIEIKKEMRIAMKQFVKENLYTILFYILISLVLLLWGRLIVAEFSHHAYEKHLHTTEARVRCLAYYGWQVDKTSETEETVYIPQAFDAVWNRYNELQHMSGFDLLPYRGESAIRYTYRALEFPGCANAEDIFIHLLVKNDTAIGGDCMSVSLSGFMLPLDIRSVIQR